MRFSLDPTTGSQGTFDRIMQTTLSSLFLLGPLVLGALTARADSTGGASLAHPARDFGAERPVARVAPHVVRETVWSMPASPDVIFPLLCPVREYDWIPTWRARLVHSVSGVAELGCIFETHSPRDGRSTWVCTRYEPPGRIEYTIFHENGLLARLTITLRATAAGTEMVWIRTWHALNAQGEASLAHWDDAALEQLDARLQQLLRHFLETGIMLPAPAEG